MTTMSATEARKRLYKLLDEVSQSHEPVQITGKRGNAVLVSEDDWRAVQETLYLVSIPGMRESILEGMAPSRRPSHSTVRRRCSTTPTWHACRSRPATRSRRPVISQPAVGRPSWDTSAASTSPITSAGSSAIGGPSRRSLATVRS